MVLPPNRVLRSSDGKASDRRWWLNCWSQSARDEVIWATAPHPRLQMTAKPLPAPTNGETSALDAVSPRPGSGHSGEHSGRPIAAVGARDKPSQLQQSESAE